MIFGVVAVVIGVLAVILGKFVMPKMQAKMEEQTRIQNEKRAAKKAEKEDTK